MGAGGGVIVNANGKVSIDTYNFFNAGGITQHFQVAKDNAAANSVIASAFLNNDGGGVACFVKSRNSTPGASTIIQSNDIHGTLRWVVADGGDLASASAAIDVRGNGTPGANDTPGRLGLYVTADGEEAPTERFRIAANGDLTATDTGIGSLSDERFKENIADFTYNLSTFKSIKPRTFTWKNPKVHNGSGTKRGFIAQELGAVDSSYTYTGPLNKESLDYSIIYNNDGSLKDESAGEAQAAKLGQTDAMYISIIQQLITKIETLESKVKTLEDA